MCRQRVLISAVCIAFGAGLVLATIVPYAVIVLLAGVALIVIGKVFM